MSGKAPTFNNILKLFIQLKDKPVPKYVIVGYPYDGSQSCPYSKKSKRLLRDSDYASDHVFVLLPNREYGRDFKNYFGYNGTFPLVYEDRKYIGGSDELESVLQRDKPSKSISDLVQEQYPDTAENDDTKVVLVGFHPHECPYSRMALEHLKKNYYPDQYKAKTFSRSDSHEHRQALKHRGTFPLIFKKDKKRLSLIGGATDLVNS